MKIHEYAMQGKTHQQNGFAQIGKTNNRCIPQLLQDNTQVPNIRMKLNLIDKVKMNSVIRESEMAIST